MPSSPLGSTHGRQRQAWHDITALGQHTRSNDVGRGMTSPSLECTHGWTTSAWHAIIASRQYTRSNDVRQGMPSSSLCSTHGRTTSGVACHHSPWTVNTVKRSQALHATIAFGQPTHSNDVARCMRSSPLGSTHGRNTSPPLDSIHGRQRRAWHDDITTLKQHT